MTNELFERLLYEEEGSTLDFKKKQYPFAKATDEAKSELLKDILGFANAWRRSQAYILIGVEDVRGGRGNVVGIPKSEHLHDHSLQQFVPYLTNHPVRFHYEAFGFEGKQVGIISIDKQTRPIYLNGDFGKLKKHAVYVRRGSSTDLNRPASPDEIARMRVDSGQSAAELVVQFSHVERDEELGTEIRLESEFCAMPANESISDLSRPGQRHPLGIDLSALEFDFMNRPNDNFYRELAHFEFTRRFFRPIRLVVENVGQVAANNVRAELAVPRDIDVHVVDASEMPDPPKRRFSLISVPGLEGITSFSRRHRGEIDINRDDERFQIEIDWGDLQPGRRVWSDVFYVAKGSSGEVSLHGLLFADNLPQPKDFALTVSISVTDTRMTVDELRSLPEPAGPED